MISIRKQIEESEHSELRFRALLKALLGLTTVLPNAALPANSEISSNCKKELERVTAPLTGAPAVKDIEEAGRVALREVEVISRSNKAALAERDTALKDVVATVAEAVSHFKGHGERHQHALEGDQVRKLLFRIGRDHRRAPPRLCSRFSRERR